MYISWDETLIVQIFDFSKQAIYFFHKSLELNLRIKKNSISLTNEEKSFAYGNLNHTGKIV